MQKEMIIIKEFKDKAGRIWSKEQLEQNFNRNYWGCLNHDFGEHAMLPVSMISHVVRDMRIGEDGTVIGTVAFLSSPVGIEAQNLVKNNIQLETRIQAYGILGENNTLKEIRVNSIGLYAIENSTCI